MYQMKQHHGWGIEELESLLPWERQIFVTMLHGEVEAENERIRQRNALLARGIK